MCHNKHEHCTGSYNTNEDESEDLNYAEDIILHRKEKQYCSQCSKNCKGIIGRKADRLRFIVKDDGLLYKKRTRAW